MHAKKRTFNDDLDDLIDSPKVKKTGYITFPKGAMLYRADMLWDRAQGRPTRRGEIAFKGGLEEFTRNTWERNGHTWFATNIEDVKAYSLGANSVVSFYEVVRPIQLPVISQPFLTDFENHLRHKEKHSPEKDQWGDDLIISDNVRHAFGKNYEKELQRMSDQLTDEGLAKAAAKRYGGWYGPKFPSKTNQAGFAKEVMLGKQFQQHVRRHKTVIDHTFTPEKGRLNDPIDQQEQLQQAKDIQKRCPEIVMEKISE